MRERKVKEHCWVQNLTALVQCGFYCTGITSIGGVLEFLSSFFQYLCELALVEYDCIQYLPSMMAASAVCLASYTVAGKIWVRTTNKIQYLVYDVKITAT